MNVEIISPCPVLNTPDFQKVFGGVDGRQIPINSLGHPVHFEFVALPKMRLRVEEVVSKWIYRISAPFYPAKKLYIDRRFTRLAPKKIKKASFPSLTQIAKRMHQLVGTKYVWGGNWSAGVPEMLHYYPPKGPVDDQTKTFWSLKGLDCSGLLFEATNGLTPRNTPELIHVGSSVPIFGKSPNDIAAILHPMDIVVWPGHVWYVYDSKFSIESKSPFGVIQRPLIERLTETCRERKGVDEWKQTLDPHTHFVVRRLGVV